MKQTIHEYVCHLGTPSVRWGTSLASGKENELDVDSILEASSLWGMPLIARSSRKNRSNRVETMVKKKQSDDCEVEIAWHPRVFLNQTGVGGIRRSLNDSLSFNDKYDRIC